MAPIVILDEAGVAEATKKINQVMGIETEDETDTDEGESESSGETEN